MSSLIAFHRMAAARGDGLLPELRELLEFRAVRIEADPGIVEISATRGDALVQAGPSPAGKACGFLPGNVIPFTGKTAQAALPVRKTSRK